MRSMAGQQYRLTPLPVFGMEVHGIDLNHSLSEETIELIKEDVTKWVLFLKASFHLSTPNKEQLHLYILSLPQAPDSIIQRPRNRFWGSSLRDKSLVWPLGEHIL